MESQSSEEGPDNVMGKDQVVCTWIMMVTYALILAASCSQLVRLFLASSRQRHRFLAKKAFNVLLCVVVALRVGEYAYSLFSPCWTVHGAFTNTCIVVDGVLKRTAGMGVLVSFFVVMVYWAEWVFVFSTKKTGTFFRRLRVPLAIVAGIAVAALVGYYSAMFAIVPNYDLEVHLDLIFMDFICAATILIAIGVGFYGIKVTLTAARFNPNPGSMLHVKILVIATLCSALLGFRAVWFLVVSATQERKAAPWSAWVSMLTFLLGEVIPISLMFYLMLPIPKTPEQFPLRRASAGQLLRQVQQSPDVEDSRRTNSQSGILM